MKILVIDDQALFRQGVAIILRELYADSSIVEASDATEAIGIARQHQDLRLVLCDLRRDGGADFPTLGRLVKMLPKAAVVVISASDDASDIAQSYKAGARGYILKSSSSDTLRHALPLILSGETYIPSSAIALVTDTRKERCASRTAETGGRSLTPRQHEILLLMAQGMQNKDIASQLGMLEGTVKVHVKSILHRLGVNNRTHAVVTGLRRGLVPRSLVLPDGEVGG
jgi:DNA-binding NarL/FixJ family response regulator